MSGKISVQPFDEALDAHENGGEKAAKREAAKRAKFQQIKTQKDDLENKIYNQNQKMQKSYFDSSIDTVKTYMDLQVLQKEMEACTEIMTGLFPNGLAPVAAEPAASAK
jgi:predicted  nucleic acid-binding Zn-ribbon protein